MSLSGLAKDNQRIFDEGGYVGPSGKRVELASSLAYAAAHTVFYTPLSLVALNAELAAKGASAPGALPRVDFTAETTSDAARRLVLEERVPRVAALNFASAKNPGGGYLTGAKAQEEDLARGSGLYPCLVTQRAYYDENRREPSLLYTDHLIYSPDVPFFRDRRFDVADEVALVSILTSPAPNAGEVRLRQPESTKDILPTLVRRAGHVLAVAAHHGHRAVILGAWGCGVFRNDPAQVAKVFGDWLRAPVFAGAFDRVVFAIYDRSKAKSTLALFEHAFTA